MYANRFVELKKIYKYTKKIIFGILFNKPESHWKYNFPIDLALNGIQIGAKSIGYVHSQSKFGLN